MSSYVHGVLLAAMARKQYSDEDILNVLRQIELDLKGGSDVGNACRKAGISDATCDTWRKRHGGTAKPRPAAQIAVR